MDWYDDCFTCLQIDYKCMGQTYGTTWSRKKKLVCKPLNLTAVSPHLLLQVFSKMDQKSFARIRRSNESVAQFMDKNRSQIKPALFHNRAIEYETRYKGKNKTEDSYIVISPSNRKICHSFRAIKGVEPEYSSGGEDSDEEIRKESKRIKEYLNDDEYEQRMLNMRSDDEEDEKFEKKEIEEEEEEMNRDFEEDLNVESPSDEEIEESESPSEEEESDEEEQTVITHPAMLSDVISFPKWGIKIDLQVLYDNEHLYKEFVGVWYPSTQRLEYWLKSYKLSSHYPSYRKCLLKFLDYADGIVGRKIEFDRGDFKTYKDIYEILKPSEIYMHKCEDAESVLRLSNPNLRCYVDSGSIGSWYPRFHDYYDQMEKIEFSGGGRGYWKEIRRILQNWTSNDSPLRGMRCGARVGERAFEGMNVRRTHILDLMDILGEDAVEKMFPSYEVEKARRRQREAEGKEEKIKRKHAYWLLRNDTNTKMALLSTYIGFSFSLIQ